MRKCNIGVNLVRAIEHLYDKATSAVLMNDTLREWFRNTIGVRQGRLLSPTLFNTCLERIMNDVLEDHVGTLSIGGRTNLRFADDIDGLSRGEQGQVDKMCRLGSVITDEGSKSEIISRIAQTTAAMTRLKTIWKDKNITLQSKIRVMRSLVMLIFPYACEAWTLTPELKRRIQTMDMRCYRKILCISYKDHVTKEEVRNRIQQTIGPYEDLPYWPDSASPTGLYLVFSLGTHHSRPASTLCCYQVLLDSTVWQMVDVVETPGE